MTVRDEILKVLQEEFGGEVSDPDGFAVRKIHERLAQASSYTVTSSVVGELDKQGLIVRDMPSAKRTTRVALPGASSRPARKSLRVLLDEFSAGLSSSIEHLVQTVVEAEAEEIARDHVELAQAEQKRAERELKKALAGHPDVGLRAQIDQLQQRVDELEEQLRISRHNAEVWQDRALGRKSVRDTLYAFRDMLSREDRDALDRLMRQLPRS